MSYKRVKLGLVFGVMACVALIARQSLAYSQIGGLFPKDSLNVRTDITGNGSWTAFTPASGSVYTVLYESMNTDSQTTNAMLHITCNGETTLAVHNLKTVNDVERFKMAKCSNSLRATTIGANVNDNTTISIIFVPYDIASQSFLSDIPLSDITSSSSFHTFPSFTAGELFQILLLFVLVMFNIFSVFRRHI